MLSSLSAVDLEVKNDLILFWIGRIDFFIAQYRVQEAIEVFRKLTKLAADPSPSNDRVRVRLALGALAADDRAVAIMLLNEMSTRLTTSEFLDLWIAGLYGNVLFYVLILAIPLVIRYAFEILRPKKKVRKEKVASEEDPQRGPILQNAGNPELMRAFVTSTGAGKIDPQFEEYLECLKQFGLHDGVDLKGIKLAYRNAVKEIHPDLQKNNQSVSDNSKFVEFTQAYDRLRELHRRFGRS